ncbi:unnamed protein product [Linum trigynum]|uniref:Uncharacterized protein n=1 Tax=Linum trigynum TaxID=586398 RepID=A0AAV2FPN3_9ROSI
MSVESFPRQILWHRVGDIPGLQRDGSECVVGEDIRHPERGIVVGQIVLLENLLNKWRHLSKLAPQQAREQMVLHLILQSNMEPIPF